MPEDLNKIRESIKSWFYKDGGYKTLEPEEGDSDFARNFKLRTKKGIEFYESWQMKDFNIFVEDMISITGRR